MPAAGGQGAASCGASFLVLSGGAGIHAPGGRRRLFPCIVPPLSRWGAGHGPAEDAPPLSPPPFVAPEGGQQALVRPPDARTAEVRWDGRVVNMAAVIAAGVRLVISTSTRG